MTTPTTMRILTSILLLSITYLGTQAQGISFSYLIPKNGYLSAPVSPFSIRGLGIGNIVGIETGASLYNVPGLGMKDLDFQASEPLVGPHFAILVPADVFVKIPTGPLITKLFAGGFGWWNINTRPNSGNIDRALRTYEEWEVLNGNWTIDDRIGYGWLAGIEFQLALSDQLTLTTEASYLNGSSKTNISGSYTGGSSGTALTTKQLNDDGAILLEGLEISIGVIMNR